MVVNGTTTDPVAATISSGVGGILSFGACVVMAAILCIRANAREWSSVRGNVILYIRVACCTGGVLIGLLAMLSFVLEAATCYWQGWMQSMVQPVVCFWLSALDRYTLRHIPAEAQPLQEASGDNTAAKTPEAQLKPFRTGTCVAFVFASTGGIVVLLFHLFSQVPWACWHDDNRHSVQDDLVTGQFQFGPFLISVCLSLVRHVPLVWRNNEDGNYHIRAKRAAVAAFIMWLPYTIVNMLWLLAILNGDALSAHLRNFWAILHYQGITTSLAIWIVAKHD